MSSVVIHILGEIKVNINLFLSKNSVPVGCIVSRIAEIFPPPLAEAVLSVEMF